jgi:type I restriction enzyme, S subunit
MSSRAKAKAMENDGKPTLTPKLRFPEFREADEWEERQLEDVAPLQRGFDLPSDLIRPGKIPIVYSNGIQKYHQVGMATAPGLVTGRSGTIGKLHFIAEGEYWPHNTSLWVTDFKGNVPRFIYYLYDLIGMSRFSSGSGVPTLNRNDVHAFRFPVPEATSEQQKIADCLTSVDELIAAQSRKVDALKTHKKGLMKQLFPREGETQPRLRFPEFQDAGEWGERHLEDVAPLQRGFDLPSDLIRPGKIPIVYSNGIQKYHQVGMATAPGLVTGRSGTIGKLHFIAVGEYWPHNTSLWVTDFMGNVPRFIYYLYDSIGMSRFSSGSGVPTLNRNDVHAFRFPVPDSTAEQQRIADCLTTVDELIATQTQKLDALKIHKSPFENRYS